MFQDPDWRGKDSAPWDFHLQTAEANTAGDLLAKSVEVLQSRVIYKNCQLLFFALIYRE